MNEEDTSEAPSKNSKLRIDSQSIPNSNGMTDIVTTGVPHRLAFDTTCNELRVQNEIICQLFISAKGHRSRVDYLTERVPYLLSCPRISGKWCCHGDEGESAFFFWSVIYKIYMYVQCMNDGGKIAPYFSVLLCQIDSLLKEELTVEEIKSIVERERETGES